MRPTCENLLGQWDKLLHSCNHFMQFSWSFYTQVKCQIIEDRHAFVDFLPQKKEICLEACSSLHILKSLRKTLKATSDMYLADLSNRNHGRKDEIIKLTCFTFGCRVCWADLRVHSTRLVQRSFPAWINENYSHLYSYLSDVCNRKNNSIFWEGTIVEYSLISYLSSTKFICWMTYFEKEDIAGALKSKLGT